MTKRMLTSGLWFLSIWGLGGALHVFLDVPRALILLPAIAVAAGVWVGLARQERNAPAGRWPRRALGSLR